MTPSRTPTQSRVARSGVRGKSRGVANFFHLPPISPQLVAAFGNDLRCRHGAVLLCRFRYMDQRRFFKAGQLHREIAFRQAGRRFKESEVGALATCEYGQDREPSGLVHHAIQICKSGDQGTALLGGFPNFPREDGGWISHDAALLPCLRRAERRLSRRRSGAAAESRIR